MSKIKNSHCSYCGSPFGCTEALPAPRTCNDCHNITYFNPTPVVVVMLPVYYRKVNGVLIQKRNIEPQKGEWALCSGYIDLGETWQQAAQREIREEINLESDPADFELDYVCNSTQGNILICSNYSYWVDFEQINFLPNEEVTEIKMISSPMELAFPTHTEMLDKYLHSGDPKRGWRGSKSNENL